MQKWCAARQSHEGDDWEERKKAPGKLRWKEEKDPHFYSADYGRALQKREGRRRRDCEMGEGVNGRGKVISVRNEEGFLSFTGNSPGERGEDCGIVLHRCACIESLGERNVGRKDRVASQEEQDLFAF